MLRTLLILCCLSVVASLVPAARPVSTRRNALATAAAAAAGVLAVRPATAADSGDVKVKAASVGVTPGGVKFFDKVTADTCSPFNPCTPQAGDIVKIKYKSFLSNGQMYDSSEGPGRKPVAMKFKANPPAMIPGWEEAIDGMKMGQTRVIQVPANMAYGDKGGAACSKGVPAAICSSAVAGPACSARLLGSGLPHPRPAALRLCTTQLCHSTPHSCTTQLRRLCAASAPPLRRQCRLRTAQAWRCLTLTLTLTPTLTRRGDPHQGWRHRVPRASRRAAAVRAHAHPGGDPQHLRPSPALVLGPWSFLYTVAASRLVVAGDVRTRRGCLAVAPRRMPAEL